MIILLKNTISLFLLMLSCTIFFLSTDVKLQISSGEGNYFDLALLYYFPVLVILYIIFYSSLVYVKNKLEKGDYFFRKFLIYNLFLAFSLYFIAIGLSIIFSFLNSHGESGMLVIAVVLFGIWISPLAVLIFSFLPGLIYRKLCGYTKITKTLNILTLFFTFIIFILSLVSFSTCSFYEERCLAFRAIKYDKLNYCDKAKKTYQKEICKSLFYEQKYTKQDVGKDYCDKISSSKIKDDCFLEIATKKQNPNLCEEIISKDKSDSCYYFLALNNQNVSLCKLILSEYDFNNCIKEIAKKTQDSSLCEMVRDTEVSLAVEYFNECIMLLSAKDKRLCDKIKPIEISHTGHNITNKEDCLKK